MTETNSFCRLRRSFGWEMQDQRSSKWAKLPEELVISVMEVLIRSDGNKFSAAANLRSTCKAWHAASRQYPAALACSSSNDLVKLCKAFPRLASIDLGDPSWNISGFQPLRSCTQLTHISMRDERDLTDTNQTPQCTDFSNLPKSLSGLSLANIMPVKGSASHLSNVTRLRCEPMADREKQLSALLKDLPQLQVGLPCQSCALSFSLPHNLTPPCQEPH